jgi:hypothetical protein
MVSELDDDGERIAVLEVKFDLLKQDLDDIKTKLDELLHLKSKGMGALGLVSLLIGSGMLGVIVSLFSIFAKPHV